MKEDTINKVDTSIIELKYKLNKLNNEIGLLNFNLNSLNKKCNTLIYGSLIIIFALIIDKICINIKHIKE